MTLSTSEQDRQNTRRRQAWDMQASRYDRQIGWWERRLLGQDHRAWACERASGDVLEVAIGTGLNLPLYPTDSRVTGVDLSPEMLEVARRRADELDRKVDLQEGDAHHLGFPDESFDTVICTFSLCNIPNPDQALSEMHRVLRPDGRLVLVDHTRSTVPPIFWLQKGIELLSVRIDGDYMTRRPADLLDRHGFQIIERERFRWGIVERLAAANTAPTGSTGQEEGAPS